MSEVRKEIVDEYENRRDICRGIYYHSIFCYWVSRKGKATKAHIISLEFVRTGD
ncbi:MAG: hypothetical protein MJZ28_01580 [Paludibacteraceae bacterium]|nr:hypothetical protein [Paludibacteraceae bacterium]